MTEDEATEGNGAADEDAAAEDHVWDRETAPQSPFTMRQVGIGLLVFAVAAAVAFGVPILLT